MTIEQFKLLPPGLERWRLARESQDHPGWRWLKITFSPESEDTAICSNYPRKRPATRKVKGQWVVVDMNNRDAIQFRASTFEECSAWIEKENEKHLSSYLATIP